jgi:hypothetical protein
MNKPANRARVAKWRAKKLTEGYKSLTVYLPREVLDMIEFLHGNYRTRQKTARLIEMSIRALYDQARRNGR